MLQGGQWAFSVTTAEVSVQSYKTARTWSIVTGCRCPHGGWAFSVTNSDQGRIRQLYFAICRAILAYLQGGEQWTRRRILGWGKRGSQSSCTVFKANAWAKSFVSCMPFYGRCATAGASRRKRCSARLSPRMLSFLIFSPKKRKERFELKPTARNKRFLLQAALWENVLIRVCVLCYKLFEGNRTPCGSFVSPQIRVRVNAHFVILNAHFARVNAHFVRVNAHFGWRLDAFFRLCNTKRSLLPFKWCRVCV